MAYNGNKIQYRNAGGYLQDVSKVTYVSSSGVSTVVYQTTAANTFTLTDAGISFSITQFGTISLGITQGILTGTNYTNGQNIGTNNGTISLTGSVVVPNNPQLWTNAGQLVPISGISTTQQSYSPPQPTFILSNAGIQFSVSNTGTVFFAVLSGTASGTNYTNGQNLGTVSVATTRTLTGFIIVPSGYSNTGSSIPIFGISSVQQPQAMWSQEDAVVSVGSLAVAADGTTSGTPSVIGADYVDHEWLGEPYSTTPFLTQRFVRVQYEAPASEPNAGETGFSIITVYQSPTSEFLASDINVQCSGNIPHFGGTQSQLALYISDDNKVGGTLSVTNTIFENSSQVGRYVDIDWAWQGVVPAGFSNSGENETITGTISCFQEGSPAAAEALSATFVGIIELEEGAGTQVSQYQLEISPSNGSWNITYNAPGVTITPTNGEGDTQITVIYQGTPIQGAKGAVRQGDSSTGQILTEIQFHIEGNPI